MRKSIFLLILLVSDWSSAAERNVTFTPSIANDNSAQQAETKSEYISGVCELVELRGSGQADLFPGLNANAYLQRFLNAASNNSKPNIGEFTAIVTVLQQPQHGWLEPTNGDGDWTNSRYKPNQDYLGNDSFIMQVEGNGYTVKLNYFVYITDGMGETFFENEHCKADIWKISSATASPTIASNDE